MVNTYERSGTMFPGFYHFGTLKFCSIWCHVLLKATLVIRHHSPKDDLEVTILQEVIFLVFVKSWCLRCPRLGSRAPGTFDNFTDYSIAPSFLQNQCVRLLIGFPSPTHDFSMSF